LGLGVMCLGGVLERKRVGRKAYMFVGVIVGWMRNGVCGCGV